MNQSISKTYKNVSNFRLGAEALLTKYFMVRGGFGYYGNPYKASGVNGQRMDFSGGIPPVVALIAVLRLIAGWESFLNGRSLIDAAVEITLLLQNLSEHHGDLRGAKLQHFRRNAARISRT